MGTTAKGKGNFKRQQVSTSRPKPTGWGKVENYPTYFNRARRRAK